MISWHAQDLVNRMCCIIEDGKKISMPRYYKQFLFEALAKRLVPAPGKVGVPEIDAAIQETYNERVAEAAEALRKKVAYWTSLRMIAKEEKSMLEGGEAYWADKAERDLASFRAMYSNAEQGRNKI